MTTKKQEIKKLQKESDEAYKYLKNFCDDYTKDDEEKVEFFKNLNAYLEAEIELDKQSN